MEYTVETVSRMTAIECQKLGVQQYRDGRTFKACDVRPPGFMIACFKARRLDLIDALDYGWTIANLAEPVKMSDGTIWGSSPSNAELERICNA